ncbi:MAG TPA: cytochrome C oxidase subunit IV family protein [Anaerolineae bacterium]
MHTTHRSRPIRYIAVFVGLAILTATEIALATGSQLEANLLIPILIVLAAAKAALVALFFMHLRDDTKWFSLIFIYPMLLASLLIFFVVFPTPK